jgi:hypothetical protein
MSQGPGVDWQRNYGGTSVDWGWDVQQTSDGGYVVVGKTSSFGGTYGNVYIVRTDASGDTLWMRYFGRGGPDQGNSVRQTSDGGYIVAGHSRASYDTDSDVYLIKLDVYGDSVWTRVYGGPSNDMGNSVWQTSDGGYIIAGETASFGSGGKDVYLLRVDANGDSLWARAYGGADHDYCKAVQETFDGSIIAAGWTESFGPGWAAIYLVKTDADGDTIWTRTYGGSAGDYGHAMQETADHGYIIAGNTGSFSPFGICLIKTDADGDTVWTRAYGEDEGHAVHETSDGGYVVVGTTWFECGMEVHCANAYVVKTTPDGSVEWTEVYGGADDDVVESVRQTADGGYVMAGFTESAGAGGDVLLIKTEGDLSEISEPASTIDFGFSVGCMPNPSGAGVTISYAIPTATRATICLYDIYGREVKTILSKTMRPGRYIAFWDGTDFRGDQAPCGVYFCQLRGASRSVIHKVILIR